MSHGLSILNEDFKILEGPRFLHQLIQWQRDAYAIDFLDADGERHQYTYAALRRCVLSTASLLEKTWKIEDSEVEIRQKVVPVFLPQSPALYIAIIAILEAGAAFCPINLDSPPDRIKFVCEDVSAMAIITSAEYEHLASWTGGPQVMVIEEYMREPTDNIGHLSTLSRKFGEEDLAYVMYTSGSSGTPKGVEIGHLAASQSLLAHDRYIPPFERFLQFAAPSFDVSVFEIFFPLFRGSTLVGCTRPQMLNDLASMVKMLEVDAAELTPTVVSSLVQQRSNVPGIKLLLTIGEMLTRPVVESFGSSDGQDGILYAMYGPTEAAIHCTVNPKMGTGVNTGNIGVPFDTVSTFIGATRDTSTTHTDIEILPIGEVGELILGGPQLANGYLNRKEQNEASFVSVRGQRAYRTGDKARIMSNGTIEILGRISSGQVKLRGQRVELGEIEAALYRHPGVKTVSAGVLNGILIAFVLTKDTEVRVEEILKTCTSWLPAFMVPSELIILSAFPYLPSGKVDKRKLQDDYEMRQDNNPESVADWDTPTEQDIGRIIQDLLGIVVNSMSRLATHGLDSLVSIRVSSKLRSAGFHLSPIEILRADNIRSMAEACDRAREVHKPIAVSNVRQKNLQGLVETLSETSQEQLCVEEIEYSMPCTPLQDAMLSETSIDGTSYNNRILLELPATVNQEEAHDALRKLVQTNAILRTGFFESLIGDSTYLQVVRKYLPHSQIERVKCLYYDGGSLQNLSLIQPLFIQMSYVEGTVRLLFHIHHALYDAWSLELLLDDLESILSNREVKFRPPYDCVVQQYYGVREEMLWPSRDYWSDHLSDLNLSSMPSFHSITDVKQSLKVRVFETNIGTGELEFKARSLGVSPQSLFQAAIAVVLSSYLGSTDICFGTVFSGRTSSIDGIEDIIGPCLSTLPIRIDLAATSTLEDLVQQLNLTSRRHMEHSFLPLRDIKKSCGIDPGQPLFDFLLVWQQTLHNYNHVRDHVHVLESTDFLEFLLTLEVTPTPVHITIKANYQIAVFPSLQVDFLLRQIQHVVFKIIEAPETSLSVARTSFYGDLTSVENSAPQLKLAHCSLVSSVEAMAENFPDRPAIEFARAIELDHLDSVHMTYSELNIKSNKIAHYLLSHHVLPNELVCIYMEKSVELYVSILATLKVSAGYVPVAPDTPPERIQRILSDANVKVIMSHSSLASYSSFNEGNFVVFIDRVDLSATPSRNLSLEYKPDNLAYCVFTSGSTGKPKGVLITHGNLLSNLQVLAELYPHSHNSRLLQSCSQAFDVSVFEIFFSWHVGACLCSAVKDVMFRDIELAIRELQITHLSLTPTVAALVNPENVPNVKFLVTAGEAVTEKVFNNWAGRGLQQGYGPSETTNICTIRTNVAQNQAINNIGHPLKNTSVFVLFPGDDFALVPRGGEGEFCFGGAQVGRGYLDPAQGVGKFIDHPKHGRLYRSGDFGRLLPDGSLNFTGRKDEQVKVRGQRIELGEINNMLLRSSKVQDCTSLVIEEADQSGQQIVSFWTSGKNTEEKLRALTPDIESTRELFASLASTLPSYIIPSAIISVSCLPSTVQGKIDKRSLMQLYKSLDMVYLEQVSLTQKREINHKWTELERRITSTLAKVAKMSTEDIGPDTSLFALGIDSLSAISLSRALLQDINVRLEISDILRYSSVSRLAARISQIDRHANGYGPSESQFRIFDAEFLDTTKKSFAKDGKPIIQVMPCTPLQEAMLSAAEISSDHAYQNCLILELQFGIEKCKSVWAHMIRRHEILRTCFVRTNHPRFAYAQVVLKDFNPEWKVIKNPEDSHSFADKYLPNFTQHVPPYGIAYSLSSVSVKFLLSIHHALYDGYAMSILFEEMEMVLRDEMLPPALSFAPFLEYMSFLNLERADQYWQNILRGFNSVIFPTSKTDTEVMQKTNDKRSRTTNLRSKRGLDWIESQVKTYSTTLLCVCQAAWASTISIHLQELDVCFGNIISGRTAPVKGLDRLVAPCFNTVPIRIKNLHNLSFLEAFREMQSQNVGCLPFQLTPLRRIQSRFGEAGTPLFDTLLILQPPARSLDASIWSIIEDSGDMDLPIVIEITPLPDSNRLELALHSHRQYMSHDEAVALVTEFESILTKALENPRNKILPQVFYKNRIEASRKPSRKQVQNVDPVGNFTAMNAMEKDIYEVIAQFTNVLRENIQRNTTIYRLGLDSINAVQIAASLRKKGYTVLGSDVLQNPSIAQLAIHLGRVREAPNSGADAFDFEAFDKRHRSSICSRLHIPAGHVEAIRPCTPVQCGMLAQSLHSDGLDYFNSLCLELSSGTSLTRLRHAWELSMRKFEMLRTGFVEVEDSSCPFYMVTFREKYSELSWSLYDRLPKHASLDSLPISRLESLSKRPWWLEISEEDNRTLVRFTAHHAIYDAQSLELILSDAATNYVLGKNTLITNQPLINPLLEALLNARNHNIDARKAFWSVENCIHINRFPDLNPLHTSSIKNLTREKTSRCSLAELEILCRKRDVSIQVAGQVAWGKLLSAYLGEDSITFAVTLSGRSVIENSDQIPFPTIVTLPVSLRISGTNSELLNRTMQLNARLHEHQFTPLISIQNWAGISEGKVFDTLFAYQKTKTLNGGPKAPWEIVREESSAEYAVSIEMQPLEDGRLQHRLTFKERLIPAEQAGKIIDQFDALLLETLQNPDGDFSLTLSVDRVLLSITPAAEPTLPSPVKLLHELLEMQLRFIPHKNALEFTTANNEGQHVTAAWTYEQLNRDGNKIANLILSHRVEKGDLVGICFNKCPEASFAIIGILKAGCAYVALDPTAPPDRVKFIVEDSGCTLVLTAGDIFPTLSKIFAESQNTAHIKVINVGDAKVIGSFGDHNPKISRPIDPQDTCYCLYTSGTTGTPKGCEITHENAVQAMMSFQKLFEGHWTEDSKWLQFASFHFDVSVLEQFWSWSVGICVATAPRDIIFEDIPGIIRELGITHIDLTPSLARFVHPSDVPSLTKGVFITGGEQLKQEILDVWGDFGCIYNGYGPTEATIGVTMYPRVPKMGKPSNIGPQFLNVGSYVLKPGMTEPVLRGAVGELCVSGKLVGKGYLNRPELTEERFPRLDKYGERIYRTGDLVRILHDGSFLFLGRADDQVKLRGQRLELNEINEVIKTSTSEIHEAVTLVLKHSKQQKEQLVTFFVLSSTNMPASLNAKMVTSMRNACKGRLPGYMVPTYFIALDKMPLSANNKADFRQLGNMYDKMSLEELQSLGSIIQAEKKWTGTELDVVAALSKILDIENGLIVRGTSIFELGIDSISVIGLARGLKNAGFDNASLSVVMKNSSIDGLVRVLASDQNKEDSDRFPYLAASQRIAAFAHINKHAVAEELGIDAADIESLAPCTPAQEGMIYRFLGSEEALYLATFNFDLKPFVDMERLEQSWMKTASQVQILRTKFVLTNEGCAQVFIKDCPPTWGVSSIPEANLQQFLQQEQFRFSMMSKSTLLSDPCCINIVNAGSRRVLSLTIFHALYDGISLPLLLQKVQEEYYGIASIEYGPPFHSTLPHGPLAAMPGAEIFWRNALKDSSYIIMPQLIDSSHSSGHGVDVSVSKTVSAAEVQRLHAIRQKLGITHQAIFLAAWSSVFYSILEQHSSTAATMATPLSPIIGLITSGRTFDIPSSQSDPTPEPHKIIGPLLNTTPFPIKIQKGMSWDSLMRICHDFSLAAVAGGYSHTPLNDVQKWCGGGAGKPLFDTLFVFQTEGDESRDENSGARLWEELPSEIVADYPIAFEVQLNHNGDVSLTIVGQKDYITETVGMGLLGKVTEALTAIQSPENTVPISADVRRFGPLPETIPQTGVFSPAVGRRNSFNWTPTANIIREEMESLAETKDINEEVSIFSLGLDSIDIIKLVSRLKKRGIYIPVSSIIRGQTIANMVDQISDPQVEVQNIKTTIQEYEQRLMQYLHGVKRLPPDAVMVLPATPLQEGMVAEMIASEYIRYFNHEVYRVASHVDMEKLKKAWDHVIQRSDIFRTTFIEIDDVDLPMSFAQVVCRPRESYWHTIQLPADASLEEELENITRAAIETATTGTLFQLFEIRHGNNQYFSLSIAHALYDGWSIQGLHEDVYAAYRGNIRERPDPRPSLEAILNTGGPEAERFWKTSLTGLRKSLFLPREGQQVNEIRVIHRQERPSPHTLSQVQEFCRKMSISLQILGQTCWAIVLATHLKQLDVVFGVVLSCRDTEEANELMFPLMNTAAVRSVMHGSVADMLRYMQDNGNSMRPYQHFPLRMAQAMSGIRDGNLFDTLFIYQGRARSRVSDDEKLYESISSASEVEFAVCVEMEIIDDALVWRTACRDDVLTAKETDRLLDDLDDVLGRVMEHPQMSIISSNSDRVSVCELPSFPRKHFVEEGKDRDVRPISKSHASEWTQKEMALRKILSQVSKIAEEQISKDQTIFHLGLDSISAIKVSSLLRRQGIRLGVNDMMKSNILEMADIITDAELPPVEQQLDVDKILDNALKEISKDVLIRNAGIDPENVDYLMPVTAGQIYMISRWQVCGGTMFIGTFTYRIEGPPDPSRLEKAWRALLSRNSILRTAFVVIGNSQLPVVQIVLTETDNRIKWSESSVDEISLTSPLSLSVDLHEEHAILRLRIHHALYDGVSLPLLLHDFEMLYASREDALPAGDGFRRFVAEGLYQQANIAKRQREYWTSYLKTSTLVSSRLAADTLHNRSVKVFEPDNQIGNLAATAQKCGVSVDAMLLATFSTVYQQLLEKSHGSDLFGKSREVVFGVYLANRAPYSKDLFSLAAPTLNLLPICVSTTGTLMQVAQRIQLHLRQLNDAAIVGTSLADIYEWTGVRVDCFVNILKVAGSGDGEEMVSSTGLLREEDVGTRKRRGEVLELRQDSSSRNSPSRTGAKRGLSKFHDAYLPSLDIEMRLSQNETNDDIATLDIGVFAPLDYLGVEDSQAVVERILSQLRGLD